MTETTILYLIENMSPVLHKPVYVFVSAPNQSTSLAELEPLMHFREAEGTTLIVERETAERAGLVGHFPCRHITLSVLSELESVGFVATVTTHLAQAGIAVNPVAGFFHDHLFVPEDRAEEALQVLLKLSQTTG